MKRKIKKLIHVGSVPIGGTSPISIQSMTKSDTRNIQVTLRQIKQLARAGCDIVRVSVPDNESLVSFAQLVKKSPVPLVADIHFNWRLAVRSIEAHAAGIRINPGNIGTQSQLHSIVSAAREHLVPIRVGSNSGSLSKKWLTKYGGPTTDALVESALEYIGMIEKCKYENIKVSVKSTDITITTEAYKEISKRTWYPLHIGVTEAGPLLCSAVRSSVALGTLLQQGIGDTIRISVSGDPLYEIIMAKELLQSLGLRRFGPKIISCPTCARCSADVMGVADKLYSYIMENTITSSVKSIAVMGCVVNGPGEARECDVGIACGKKESILFEKGKQNKKIKNNEIFKVLKQLLQNSGEIT